MEIGVLPEQEKKEELDPIGFLDGLYKKVDTTVKAVNFNDHIDWRDPLGWETLGQRFSEQTVGKEWREGQMQDIWNAVPESWRPNIAETAMSAAEGFGNYWQGARTVDNKYNPFEYAEAGTARTIEGVGSIFEGMSQLISKGTGLDIELARLAADFVPVGRVARIPKSVGYFRRSTQLANKLSQLDATTAKRVVDFANKIDPSLDPLQKYTLLTDAFPQISLAEESGFLNTLSQKIDDVAMLGDKKQGKIEGAVSEFKEWIGTLEYEGKLQQLKFNIEDPLHLLEPGKKLGRLMRKGSILEKFKDNPAFQTQVAEYLNMAYWWRKTNKSTVKGKPMKGFPLGNTIEAPDGTLYLYKDGGFTNKSKAKEYGKLRDQIRKIDKNTVRMLFWNVIGNPENFPDLLDAPLESLRLADAYLEMNQSLTRHLVKRIRDINTAAGKTVISVDHINPIKDWLGTGADIYWNLMPMDLRLNTKLGARKNPGLATALGAPKSLEQDILIWLDKFGPSGTNRTGQLWGFFRNLPTEKRKILWNAVINRGVNVEDALEALKLGDEFFQGTLF